MIKVGLVILTGEKQGVHLRETWGILICGVLLRKS